MAYNILKLADCTPEPGKIYLFDTNVWRFVVLAPATINAYEQSYVDFFQDVYQLATDEECQNKPKIFVNNLIFSEVFHACMNIHMKAFNENQPVDKTPKEYRDTHHAKTRKKALLSDIEIYKDAFITTGDESVDCLDTLLTTPDFCDYADHFYYKTARSSGMTVVTMDGDFKFEDIEIITANGNLIKLMRNS